MRIFIIPFLSLFILLPFAITQARIIHVPADSSAIQAGINGASDGDTVLVARGHYYERINFLGKAIVVASNFIIDHDTTSIDSTIIDADTLVLGATDSGSVVTFCNGEVSTSVIQGFTLQNGTGTMNCSHFHGGGINCWNRSPTITNCTIKENTADTGGGIYCYWWGSTITSCTITGNTANEYGGGIFCYESFATITGCNVTGNTANWGGGIYCYDSFDTITNCIIADNTAYLGGGISCGYGSPTITNCTISGDTATYGGGLCCSEGSPTISACTVTGNTANWGGGISCLGYFGIPTISHCTISGNRADWGGGIYCRDPSNPIITNCTIAENTAEYGGGLCCHNSPATISNCILWADDSVEIYLVNGSPVITYSDIEGGWPGAGNLNCDPMFCYPDTGNYYVNDSSCCKGAGCDSLGNPDSNRDIGAFGVGCGYVCGDANEDSTVNIVDVVYLINYIFIDGPPPDPLAAGDVDLNTLVDIEDVVYLIKYLFRGGPAPCQL